MRKANHRKQGPKRRSEQEIQGIIFQTPSGGIAARSGTTPGSAECTPYYINSSGALTELTNPDGTSRTHTVYHIGATAVAGTTYIQAKRCHGRLVADMEDCGT